MCSDHLTTVFVGRTEASIAGNQDCWWDGFAPDLVVLEVFDLYLLFIYHLLNLSLPDSFWLSFIPHVETKWLGHCHAVLTLLLFH